MHSSRNFRLPSPPAWPLAQPARISSIKPATLGLVSIAALIAGVIGWAASFPMTTSITTIGTVIVQNDRKSVQHPDGGVVSQVLVRDGDVVQAGQPLIRFDSTRVMTLLASSGDQLASALEQQAQLAAQLRGERTFAPVAATVKLSQDALDSIHAREIALLRQVSHARTAQIATLDQARESEILAAEGCEQLEGVRKQQLVLLTHERDRIGLLAKSGDESKAREDDVQRALLDALGAVVELSNRARELRSKAEETKLEKDRVQDAFAENTLSDLMQADRAVADARARYDELQEQRSRLTVSSPEAGTVLALAVHASGAVVDAGAVLMQIVPTHGVKVIEGHVSPSEVSGISVGAIVRCRATSAQGEPVYFEAKVASVSADRLIDRSATPYFRIETSFRQSRGVPLDLHVGASVDMMITTGKETAVEKALAPIVRSFQTPEQRAGD